MSASGTRTRTRVRCGSRTWPGQRTAPSDVQRADTNDRFVAVRQSICNLLEVATMLFQQLEKPLMLSAAPLLCGLLRTDR